MDVNAIGGSVIGSAKGGASVDGMTGSSVAPVNDATEIQAARLPVGRPAVPGPVSRELLWAQLRAQHEYKYLHGYLWVHPWENLYTQVTCVQVPST